ncbi:hypothetical protein LTR37_018796 [Vermiconidia calcicola]|uniref:Uncharacterized protein n=1 Tax=Vermiconidia calcicola TaxID=1690605 RepID=A0ACC3MHU1_9PEZI|nr:hypothetical protein LTR37_018796 [Vermiconidia calcicola]
MANNTDEICDATIPKNILTIIASKHLTGHAIADVVEKDWKKVDPATKASFKNVGFDVDPTDTSQTLTEIRQILKGQPWDGILLGWCLRGYAERTEIFESIVQLCVDEMKTMPTLPRLMFCTGPTNLADATLRNLPVE